MDPPKIKGDLTGNNDILLFQIKLEPHLFMVNAFFKFDSKGTLPEVLIGTYGY